MSALRFGRGRIPISNQLLTIRIPRGYLEIPALPPIPTPNQPLVTHSHFALPARRISSSPQRLDLPQWPGPAIPQPPVGPSDPIAAKDDAQSSSSGRGSFGDIFKRWADNPLVQAAITTVLGLGVVFVGGIGYLEWYKANVLNRMEEAFAPGYDPALELGVSRKHLDGEEHVQRHEQALVHRIVDGTEVGSYWLMLGSKGTGKGTMIIE